jgi:hypothetical protein
LGCHSRRARAVRQPQYHVLTEQNGRLAGHWGVPHVSPLM